MRTRLVLTLLVAALAVGAAYAGTATLTVPTTDGTAIALTVTPTSIPLRTDVAAPGADWAFSPTRRAYFPDVLSWGNAWVYSPAGTYGCVRVAVTTYLTSWTLRVSATVTPAQPLSVALFRQSPILTGLSVCTEPTAASSSPLLLGTTPVVVGNAGGSLTAFVGLGVHATGPVSGNPTITLNWTASSP
jgi:hypothetical protein